MQLKEQNVLPAEVFQMLTALDKKKIEKLCHETNMFVHGENCSDDGDGSYSGYNRRLDELEFMEELGYKVELESLNWLSIDYITNWLLDVLVTNEKYNEVKGGRGRVEEDHENMDEMDDCSEDGHFDIRLAI